MLNFRIRQLSRSEKNYKPMSLNFSGSKQIAPTENFKNVWGEALLLERIFFSLFL